MVGLGERKNEGWGDTYASLVGVALEAQLDAARAQGPVVCPTTQ
jgi:hypothetical protein